MNRYTAVGRKEILTFFYLYALVQFLALFLDSGIIPISSSTYPVRYHRSWSITYLTQVYIVVCDSVYSAGGRNILESPSKWVCRVSVCGRWHASFALGEYTCYLEKRTVDNLLFYIKFLRLTSLLIFGVAFFISIATFKNLASFSNIKPVALWVVMYIFDFVCALVYIVLQFVLVLRTLEDRWPIGDLLFGSAFFAIGQVILYGFSIEICNALQHYLDSLFCKPRFWTIQTIYSDL